MTRQDPNKLRSIVDQLIELNRELLELAKTKQDAIFEDDIERLEECTKRQGDITGQIEELNTKRKHISENHLPDSEPPISLTTIAESLDGPESNQLAKKCVELKDILRDVQRFARENQRLLENRMSMFEELFERLGDDKSNETYDSETKKDSGTTGEAMIFDEAI